MIDKPDSWATWLTSVAAILNAVAWPAVVAWFLFVHRFRISHILEVLERKLSSAKKFKAGPLELEDLTDELKESVNKASAQVADETEIPKTVPEKQFEAAVSLQEKVRSTKLSEPRALEAVKSEINDLARKYGEVRANMPRGSSRTKEMNQIAAGMRTLALAGRPLWGSLSRSALTGKRLAAICMLQIKPERSYYWWLMERFKIERHAFVLYQSAIAVLEYVKKRLYRNADKTLSTIQDAIQAVSAYNDGKPDQNTLDVLNDALSMVR